MSKTVPKALAVLVVDDEDEIRLMERRILEKAGCQVIEAADGPTAICCGKARHFWRSHSTALG